MTVVSAAKVCPKGLQKRYVQGWSREFEDLYNKFKKTKALTQLVACCTLSIMQGMRNKYNKFKFYPQQPGGLVLTTEYSQ